MKVVILGGGESGVGAAILAIILRKELLIPVLCGIFLIENLSVMLQVARMQLFI